MSRSHFEAIDLISRALRLAMESHSGQFRSEPGGKVPYIVHPFRVAELVRRAVGDEDPELIAAALLHDVIEDSGARFDEVARACGPRVAQIVAELTNDSRLPQAERKQDMLARLAHASVEAKTIKLADRIDNLRHIAAWANPQRRERFVRESWQMLDLLRGTCAELEEQLEEMLRSVEQRPQEIDHARE